MKEVWKQGVSKEMEKILNLHDVIIQVTVAGCNAELS